MAILRTPSDYFRKLGSGDQLTITTALVFALVTHWVARSISYLWGGLQGRVGIELLNTFEKQLGTPSGMVGPQGMVMQWLMGVGSVLVDPFQTLLSVFFSCLFVYIGAAVLVPQKARFETTLKVVCMTHAASALLVLPIFGPLIAPIYRFVLLVIGLREVYQVGTTRATVVASFPWIVMIGLGAWFFLMLGALALVILSAVV